MGTLVEVGSVGCGGYKETRMGLSRSDWTLKRKRVRKIKNFESDWTSGLLSYTLTVAQPLYINGNFS